MSGFENRISIENDLKFELSLQEHLKMLTPNFKEEQPIYLKEEDEKSSIKSSEEKPQKHHSKSNKAAVENVQI